jgi:hypothetical protein
MNYCVNNVSSVTSNVRTTPLVVGGVGIILHAIKIHDSTSEVSYCNRVYLVATI